MFCKHCGAPIDNDSVYCTACGAGVGETRATPVTPAAPSPLSYNQAGPSPTKVMVFGIIGLALSSAGIPGIVLSLIALKLAGEFVHYNGSLYGQAKVGRILGKVGSIVSIVMTVVWAFYIVFVIMMIVGGSAACVSSGYNYHYYY